MCVEIRNKVIVQSDSSLDLRQPREDDRPREAAEDDRRWQENCHEIGQIQGYRGPRRRDTPFMTCAAPPRMPARRSPAGRTATARTGTRTVAVRTARNGSGKRALNVGREEMRNGGAKRAKNECYGDLKVNGKVRRRVTQVPTVSSGREDVSGHENGEKSVK